MYLVDPLNLNRQQDYLSEMGCSHPIQTMLPFLQASSVIEIRFPVTLLVHVNGKLVSFGLWYGQ